MSYVKQNFASGQTLTADQLNHIENGIAAIENEPKSIVQQITHTALKEDKFTAACGHWFY